METENQHTEHHEQSELQVLETVQAVNNKYVILQETNGEEFESWMYFIKYNGNEENLNHLQNQLEMVDFFIYKDYSTFDLELEAFVSETTAKEMTLVDLNHCSPHRKFDGTLKYINFGFSKSDSNKKKMKKVFQVLGRGNIDQFIDLEDVDENISLYSSSSDDNDHHVDTDDESVSSSDSEYKHTRKNKKHGQFMPPSVLLKEIIQKKENERKKQKKR